MKISLITLISDSYSSYYVKPYHGSEHVGIHTLTSILRKVGHDVQVIDGTALSLSFHEVLSRTERFRPEIVGLSPTLFTMNETLKFASIVKQWEPSPLVILGGHHSTLCAENIVNFEQDIDIVFRSEAELSMIELLDRLESNKDVKSINGLAFRNSNRVTPILDYPSSIIELDRHPNMARDTLRELRSKHPIVAANINSSRGCLNSCSFCSTPVFYKNPKDYRMRPPKSVVDEMEEVCLQNNVHLFTFTDDNFIIENKKAIKWAHQFADELIKRDLPITFTAMLRAEFFRSSHLDLITKLKEAGLHHVLIGFESIAKETLEKYHKQTKVEDYIKAVRWLEKQSLFLTPAFINFNPYLSRDDFYANIDFLSNVVSHPFLFQYTSRLLIFSGAKIAEILDSDNLLKSNKHVYSGELQHHWKDPIIKTLYEGISEIVKKPFSLDSIMDETHNILSFLFATGDISYKDHENYFRYIKKLHKEIAKRHFSIMHKCLIAANEMNSNKVSNLLASYYDKGLPEIIYKATKFRNKLLRCAFSGEANVTITDSAGLCDYLFTDRSCAA